MSIVKSLRGQLAPIHPEGYKFVLGFAVATLILWWMWAPLGWLGLIATLWCAYFFRDPVRVTPVRSDLVIAPADGVVSFAGFAAPPPELGLGMAPLQRVSIFMSVFDCHLESPCKAGWPRLFITPASFSAPISTRRAMTTSATALSSTRRGAIWRGADRRPGGWTNRVLHA